MDDRRNEILLAKKRALFFTRDVKIKTVMLLTPWNPGITGQVLGEKIIRYTEFRR